MPGLYSVCYSDQSMAIFTPSETAARSEDEGTDPAGQQHGIVGGRLSTSLKVAIGSSFVLRLAGASTGLLLATYLKQVVGANPVTISALSAVFYATELFLAPLFGALSDLHGRKPFLVFGPLAGAVAVQIHPLTTFVAILAIGRLLEGLSTAANAPGTLGYLADATSGDSKESASLRGRVMGMYEISFLIGLVGGGVLGGQLWEWFGKNGFRLVSLVYLLAAALLFFFVKESLPAAARSHNLTNRLAATASRHPVRALVFSRLRSYKNLLGEPALRSFAPAWLAINAVVGLWFTQLAPLMVKSTVPGTLTEQFSNQLLVGRLRPSEVGTVQAGFGITFMLGIFLWSLLYGRVRRTNMMLGSIAGLFIVCVVLLGINNNVLPGPWGQWPLLPFLAVGVLLESGFTPVALAYLADISETRVEHRGVVMGLYSVFLGIGQLTGGATGGFFILVLGFNGLIAATAIFGAIALSAVLWLRARFTV